MPEPDPSQRDDPVESGDLEDEPADAAAGRPAAPEHPVESGALDEEPREGGDR